MHTTRELKEKEKYTNMLKRKNKEISRLKDKILDLEVEVDIYKGICDVRKETIKKAIEYIEQLTSDMESIETMDIGYYVQEEILNILKGSDKE